LTEQQTTFKRFLRGPVSFVTDRLPNASIDDQRRARILVQYGYIFGIIVFSVFSSTRFLLPMDTPFPSPDEVITAISAVMLLAIPSTVYYTRKIIWGALLFFAACYSQVLALIVLQGGLGSPLFMALGIFPLVSLFLIGKRAAAIFAAISLIGTIVLVNLTGTSWIPPYQPYTMSKMYQSIVLGLSTTLLLAVGWLFENAKKRALHMQEETYQKNLELALEKEAAERANAAKSKFMAHVSHELRTPLNAILGYAELIEDELIEKEETETLEDLERLQQSGRHLLHLINDLLDLGKVESGSLALYREQVPISALLERLQAKLSPKCIEKQNKLSITNQLTDEALTLDQDRLEQIVWNLMSNANKFTSHGQIQVNVETSPSPNQCTTSGQSSSDWLKVAVADTGIGMSQDEMKRVFDKFVQADDSTTRAYEGTGLGLTLSRELCEHMGGKLEVESQKGKGSTFTVYLPLEEPVQSTHSPPGSA
jgi:signal transduction histidine kinase